MAIFDVSTSPLYSMQSESCQSVYLSLLHCQVRPNVLLLVSGKEYILQRCLHTHVLQLHVLKYPTLPALLMTLCTYTWKSGIYVLIIMMSLNICLVSINNTPLLSVLTRLACVDAPLRWLLGWNDSRCSTGRKVWFWKIYMTACSPVFSLLPAFLSSNEINACS